MLFLVMKSYIFNHIPITYLKFKSATKERESYGRDFVSVIIPAYNCAKYIPVALDSALIQDAPMEILVTNDCSKDHLDAVMAP